MRRRGRILDLHPPPHTQSIVAIIIVHLCLHWPIVRADRAPQDESRRFLRQVAQEEGLLFRHRFVIPRCIVTTLFDLCHCDLIFPDRWMA